MVRRLLVGVGEFDHVAIVVGTSQEGDSHWQMVARKAGRDDDGRDEMNLFLISNCRLSKR